MTAPTALAYIGLLGQGLGFHLAGIDVIECISPDEVVAKLTACVQSKTYAIIFLDEALAAEHGEEIGKLNASPLPSILLLPNSASSSAVGGAQALKNLIIKAVGSDIFTT